MRIIIISFLVFSSLVSFGQVLSSKNEIQKVALGSIVDYSVNISQFREDEAYTFFWSIRGEEKSIANDGKFGKYLVDFSDTDYKVGNIYTLSVYMQREVPGNPELCPSNVQELDIEIIDKPFVSISINENSEVCSYDEANAYSPISLNIDLLGYKGRYNLDYKIFDNEGDDVLSITGIDCDTNDNKLFVIDKDAEKVFVNKSEVKVYYEIQITNIKFIDGEVSSDLDYSNFKVKIGVLPEFYIGNIK